MKRPLITAIAMNVFVSAYANTLQPFQSDGCSAFPDGTMAQQKLWLKCCQQHDLAYWQGGTEKQRQQADKALQQCVAQTGEEEVALIMLAGVRVGGSPHLPTPFRWGYGWPYPRPYGELTEEEKKQVQALTPKPAKPTN